MSEFMRRQAKKIAEARAFLTSLEMDAERSNERSALVFLALAELESDGSWRGIRAPMIGVTPVMEWIAEHYGREYKPNTRETIRRQTLHQFVDAGLVVENPDQPDRPINSPKWCYQLTDEVLDVAQSLGEEGHDDAVTEYLETKPGLLAMYEAARELERIPVRLAEGVEVTLSPGGQNVLLREMVEEFCPRFTPGGEVLYIGDAAREENGVYLAEELARLGVVLPERGKMPDLIVYMRDRNWLVLMEAASSHGPVDVKRHRELKVLFERCAAGLVFISCFPSRAKMRKYLSEIAWETEVWCADHPDHLIHFDGERFLGPYECADRAPIRR
jgi:hypothetical protein